MTTPIDELAGPCAWLDPTDCPIHGDAARSTPVPASNVSEGLRDCGYECPWKAEAHPDQAGHEFTPASNVSEGLRDRIFETLMTGGVWDRHLRGGHSIDASKHAAALADLLAAALAHAAPERLDRERQVAFLRRYEGSDGVGEPTILFPGTAEDLLERLSQPDATDEAER